MTYIPEALRRLVAERADDRCEYCQMHEDDTFFTHEVDHIYAEKHDGPTVEWNLCLACAECNRNKGSDICSLDPETGNVVALFHPRRDRWADHFLLVDTGVIEPLTAHGRATARLLRMNRLDLVADRARLIALRSYPGEES
ncbi:MAG: HNH endonuclease [Chloroflexia bacterium]|nr:HNH endonuclease [Chloroflexia bacterium]